MIWARYEVLNDRAVKLLNKQSEDYIPASWQYCIRQISKLPRQTHGLKAVHLSKNNTTDIEYSRLMFRYFIVEYL